MIRTHCNWLVFASVMIPLACGGKGDDRTTGESNSDSLASESLSGTETATESNSDSNSTMPTASDTESSSNTNTESDTNSTSGGMVKFDLPDPDTDGETEGTDCACGNQIGFSYIWIANSNESTISKVNTETLAEEGRYLTKSDMAGSPSRTSVSLSGRSVAVANRNGGVTKVWAEAEFCDETVNGQPGVQTSMGAANILPWGQDDCVAWHTPFTYNTNRPVAWTAGTQDLQTCEYENERVWTSGCNYQIHTNVQVHRLDGVDGAILDTVEVQGFPCTGFGAYGGAADGQGNFWITSNAGPSMLARIDAVTLDTETWLAPIWGYGMTVDHLGRPWIASNHVDTTNISAARFDPVTETWDVADNATAHGYTGIGEDQTGNMWMNYTSYNGQPGGGMVAIDVDTMVVGPAIDIPGVQPYPPHWLNGVSVDLNNYVWLLCPPCNTAFRYDQQQGQFDSYAGLVFPYTYSDMTGWALQNAACDPEG